MKKQFDINNPELLESIETKFRKKKDEVVLNSNITGEKMISTIDYYKSHSLEEVLEIITNEIKEKYKKMDTKTALRNATILAFKNKGREDVPEKEIQGIIKKVTPDAASIIIANYKKIAIDKELQKALEDERKSYEFFSSIPEEEKVHFAALYQDMCLAQDLYKAKENSIKETAKEFDLELPSCFSNISAVDSESNRVIGMRDANENETSIRNNIKEKLSKISDFMEENRTPLTLSFGVSFMAGACAFLSKINKSAELAPALTSGIITTSLLMAGLVTVLNSLDIKQFFEDKKSLKEAKELGLFGLLVNACDATKEFNTLSDKVKKEANLLENNGGYNGLH